MKLKLNWGSRAMMALVGRVQRGATPLSGCQRHKDQAGFVAMELLGGMVVLFVLMPLLYFWINHGIVETQKRAAADHFALVYEAARSYALVHSATLLPLASMAGGPSLTLDDLRADGLLATVGDRNVWGQSYSLHVRKNEQDSLRLVLLTEGGENSAQPDMVNSIVPSAAAWGGFGFVPSGLIPGQNTNQLQGSYGAWTLDLPSVGITSPGPGHLGAMTDYSADDLISDQLYRVEVPGKPELNEMWTELDMTDHGIEGVEYASFVHHDLTELPCSDETEGRMFLDSSQGLFLCREGKAQLVADTGNSELLKTAMVVPNGLVTKPSCPPGHQPGIFVSPAILSAGAESPPLSSIQAWATNESDEAWRVHLRILRSDGKGWVYPDADYGRVMAMAICEDVPEVVEP